jgi:zona occludens toxin (predicted ATPase)
MRAHSKYGSKKILLILILLIGGLSASAYTFGDTIHAPLGLAREGSFFANLNSDVQVATVAKPSRLSTGTLPSLTSPSTFAFQTTVDDNGADDELGQKDLRLMAVDFGAPGQPLLTSYGSGITRPLPATTHAMRVLFSPRAAAARPECYIQVL